MYSVLDKTTKAYLNPLHFINHGDAIRWLTTVVNKDDEGNNINKYPEQFALYFVGEFDDQTGKTEGNIECIMEAMSCINEQKERYTIKELVMAIKQGENNV